MREGDQEKIRRAALPGATVFSNTGRCISDTCNIRHTTTPHQQTSASEIEAKGRRLGDNHEVQCHQLHQPYHCLHETDGLFGELIAQSRQHGVLAD